MFVAQALAQEAAVDAASEVHTEVGVAADTHQSDVFPPFDSTHFSSQILWLAITFGLFYVFLKRVLLPRIGNTMDDRRERIASDLDEAARLKQEADASVAAYEQELADARRASATIAQEARDRAKADADNERRGVEAALEANLKGAEQRIAQIKTSALADVDAVAAEAAEAIVTELVGGKADKAAVAAAVKAAQ